jgi:hypothetical protein
MPCDFKHLVPGSTYVVARDFGDFDGNLHPKGETWTYLGHSYFPYDAGLTLLISPGGSIRLQWQPESQGAIIDNLESYVKPVDT